MTAALRDETFRQLCETAAAIMPAPSGHGDTLDHHQEIIRKCWSHPRYHEFSELRKRFHELCRLASAEEKKT